MELQDGLYEDSQENSQDESQGGLQEGDQVNLKIVEQTPLGYNVLIDDEFDGLLFNSEVYQDIEEGMETYGYVKKIRDDGKIDVSLRPQGFRNVIDSDADVIMRKLDEKGYLMLTDKSSPESIKFRLQMSKKAFKRAIGGLYKDKKIELKQDRIELIK
ncbi:DNA-binding protein [Tenacibaculum finnmarkense genomovar finnmarkense]|uniref:DNA-binding protein n=1 Tax=Tenacibaculum finnmarkense genomovar finnmarkense TaxID=1458503 RepID=A0AAP1RFI4_9FLAO|nr:DNA-binding protein [Tenacibaculum finnmarkense]MCD8415671.1 DNA-binding protein [Tenacibaculum dicentrarchi]MBE7653083.1 DNA-binding protein [Tenacibaculum finnmarkense genomovar finnmarkense]MBE7660668.1 DNA-binding protein [Tenacibaculum finnmarkense genomovar finnmarkense]MBE7693359.1 DNA-binding protein [Tenacibaculum finnmarkense genomovar finnmarkense]MBE7695384.1 DNA-binding protein [Tenacibaculum finnmarkense genomovar finnmarkense]